MNKNLKMGLALLIVASVIFLCSTVAFFILKEAEKEKRLYLEEEIKEVVKAKESIAEDLEEIKIINKDLESKLSSAKEQAQKISEELAREKEAKKSISAQLEEAKKKSDQLMDDVMEEKEERLKLVHQLSELKEEYGALKSKFELMVDAKETLEGKLKEMLAKKGVELERIEVRSEYPEEPEEAAPVKELTSSESDREINVLVVNRKFNFIVAGIGKSDGVEIGTELDIYRGDNLIAKTKIEKLYDRMSAAAILPEWEKATIREGDQVYISR